MTNRQIGSPYIRSHRLINHTTYYEVVLQSDNPFIKHIPQNQAIQSFPVELENYRKLLRQLQQEHQGNKKCPCPYIRSQSQQGRLRRKMAELQGISRLFVLNNCPMVEVLHPQGTLVFERDTVLHYRPELFYLM